MAEDPPNFCSTCHSEVSPPSLSCGRCGHRIHSKQTCSGLTSRFASQLINYSGDSIQFKFICNSCKAAPLDGDDTDLNTTIRNLSKTVQDLSVLVSGLMDWKASLDADLCESVRKLSSSVSGLLEWRDSLAGDRSTVAGPSASSAPPPPALDDSRAIIREELVELREREKRRDSIVVRGLDYVSEVDFRDRFEQLSTFLINKSVHLSEITQLNPRFVRARITNKEDRSLLLSSTSRLRNNRFFSSVFVSRDLTFRQREEIKRRRGIQRLRQADTLATGANTISLPSSSFTVPNTQTHDSISPHSVSITTTPPSTSSPLIGTDSPPILSSSCQGLPMTSLNGSSITLPAPYTTLTPVLPPSSSFSVSTTHVSTTYDLDSLNSSTPPVASSFSPSAPPNTNPLVPLTFTTIPHSLLPLTSTINSPSYVSTLMFNSPSAVRQISSQTLPPTFNGGLPPSPN